jgi:hypothetical protein
MRLKTGVDGDCARGDDDSEAFAMRSEDRTSEQFLGVTQLCQAHNVISWVRNQSPPLGAPSMALEPITAAEAPPPSMDRRSAAPFGSLATRRLSGTGPRNHASLPFTVGLFPPTAFLHAFPSSFPMALDQKPAEFQLTRVCDSLSLPTLPMSHSPTQISHRTQHDGQRLGFCQMPVPFQTSMHTCFADRHIL